MQEQTLNNHLRSSSPTIPDLLAVGFRHRRLAVLSFLGIFLGGVLCALFLPKQYEAHMKVLVKRERVNPVVTTEATSLPQFVPDAVSEADLNSEVELLKSEDLLEEVVVACGLHQRDAHFAKSPPPAGALEKDVRVATAVRKLVGALKVEPLKKSNLIQVSYTSSDPELAARVLTTLANSYLSKHLAVHRISGVLEFFDQEAERYGKELAAAEEKLVRFSQEQGAVPAQLERDIVLQKFGDFDANLRLTQAGITETKQRIGAIETLAAKVSPRLGTTAKKIDNTVLLGQLKWNLLTLEQKRSELLLKFEPGYPPVREAEAEIGLTRAAIDNAEKSPVREETTDRNPTYQWLEGELAKAKVDLASMQARAAATERIVATYRDRTLALNRKGVEMQDLMRTAKLTEANYLLYLKKREEARISDALDSKRIVNVAVAEPASVPVLPVHPPWRFVLLGTVLGLVVSIGSAIVAEYLDTSFRTAEEVEQVLNVPVVAAMPSVGVSPRLQ